MAEHSAIEWTDATWNVTTGCTKVSPACANCYIERTPPFRIEGRRFVKGHIPLRLHTDRLTWPQGWTKPRRVFVNSLSDLFHEDVSDMFIMSVFIAMEKTPRHTFQILTKRAERMRDVARWLGRKWADEPKPMPWPLPNVWLGVSVENQHFADERIPLLLETPAAVRFISAEPLLGPLDLESYLDGPGSGCGIPDLDCAAFQSEGTVACCPECRHVSLDWVIAGAESGLNVRPTEPTWIRSLRDQCVEAYCPFFFKQWGGKTSKAGGRVLDGRTWDQFPASPEPRT